MFLPPSWSQSTSNAKLASFVIVNVALPLLVSGGAGTIGIGAIMIGHASEAWAEWILFALLAVWGGAGLFMLFCGTYIHNCDKAMYNEGWDKRTERFVAGPYAEQPLIKDQIL